MQIRGKKVAQVELFLVGGWPRVRSLPGLSATRWPIGNWHGTIHRIAGTDHAREMGGETEFNNESCMDFAHKDVCISTMGFVYN